MVRLCLLLLALFTAPSFAAEPVVTEVIPTQRPAEQLLPVLLPLAGPEVGIQAFRGQLVVRGPSSQVAALKTVLGQLDRPLQNLRISVRRSTSASQAGGSDRLAVRDGVATWRAQRGNRQENGSELQALTLLEGTAAWLSMDTEIPVLGIAPSGAVTGGHAPLGNGLELLPTIAGDQVRLQLRQRTARLAGADIRSTTVDTVLLVRPGEWVSLGTVAVDDSTGLSGTEIRLDERGGAVDHRRDGRRRESTGWEVRVDIPGR